MNTAMIGGTRAVAIPGVHTATCPLCGRQVLPKCGNLVTWHWAHVAARDCDDWAERDSAWHSGWQAVVPAARREIVIGPHRADIVTSTGRVVELQHSAIAVDEIRERETFYGPGMVWIFDATDAYADDRLNIRPRGRGTITFRWKHPRKSIAACRRTVLVDLGDGRLVKVKRIYPDAPCGGIGWIFTRAQIVAALNGVSW